MAQIDFYWQGVTDAKQRWRDGLWAAMQLLERKHDVEYKEPWEAPRKDAILFHWEAPCTVNGTNKEHYEAVRQQPNKKVLLFAGGPLRQEWVAGYDMLAVESKINEDECAELGIPYARAFGVNTAIFHPMSSKKYYTTVTHGTSASWKRQWLVCQAMGEKALVFGQPQETDTRPFDECEQCGSMVLHQQSYTDTNKHLNHAKVSVNCADFWGGGQRATLEAMACNLPVVVMKDSPKNREFVEEAGIGAVVDPQPERIREAVESLVGTTGGRDYVMGKWTPQHYADALQSIIHNI